MRRVSAVVGLCGVWVAFVGGQSAPPVFRVAADAVAVNVSVKRGKVPVLGLTEADFRLYDNDVQQHVAAVSMGAVPLDVSIVVDLSSSIAWEDVDTPREIVRRLVALLSPSDRFRVLLMGNSVVQAVPWQPAGPPDTSKIQPMPGLITLITDSVLLALSHHADPDRRHLVVALTDGIEQCSLASGDTLRRGAERSAAVFHWVSVQGPQHEKFYKGVTSFCKNRAEPADIGKVLTDATRLTGGSVVTTGVSENVTGITNSFNAILDDFRRSYIVHYEPEGVPRNGWHRLRVELQEKGLTVRTRPGYWGAEDGPAAR
jgi:hypothetical protein